jgi:hypothetical protein
VIREAMRLHPGVCMLLERRVPAEGLVLPASATAPHDPKSTAAAAAGTCALAVPAGTTVGINPYVIGRSRAIFGDDANEYRPERWLRRTSKRSAPEVGGGGGGGA